MKEIIKISEKTNKYIAMIACVLIIVSGCKKDTDIVDPESSILGKWTLIRTDNMQVESTDYQEFFPDSTLKFFKLGESVNFSENVYWLKDDLLFQGHISEGRFMGEAYKYQFLDKKNKLRLIPDYENTTILNITSIPVTIYQRIK